MEEEQHYLEAFLAESLPKLGLDQETYGPYITGTDEEDDDLDDIIELLRASSESHSDDDESWTAFKLQIVKRRREYMLKEKEKKEENSIWGKIISQFFQDIADFFKKHALGIARFGKILI